MAVDGEYCCTIILQWTNIAQCLVDSKRSALFGIIYRNCCIADTECTLSYFIALGMQQEGNSPQNGGTTFGFSFTTMVQHIGRCWSRIYWQRTTWQYWSIPHASWPDSNRFLPVPSADISIEGTALMWCYWHHLGSNIRAEKAYTKWLPGMFPMLWQSLAEVYIVAQMGLVGSVT